jgi:hypothetical protein
VFVEHLQQSSAAPVAMAFDPLAMILAASKTDVVSSVLEPTIKMDQIDDATFENFCHCEPSPRKRIELNTAITLHASRRLASFATFRSTRRSVAAAVRSRDDERETLITTTDPLLYDERPRTRCRFPLRI